MNGARRPLGAITICIIAAVGALLFMRRHRVSTPPSAAPSSDSSSSESWDCATSACVELEPGGSVELLGGAMTCTYAGDTAGSMQARSCLFGNLVDRTCEVSACTALLSGGCTPDCKKSRDCGDGFCQNAHYVGSRLVMDPGECSLESNRSADNPGACYTCKCR